MLAGFPSGLRASAWLARRNVAVRHLGLTDWPVPVRWPPAVYGAPHDLDDWLGRTVPVSPTLGLWFRGRLHRMPTRRRDLARLVGSSWWRLARDLRPRVRDPRSVGQWGARTFGRPAWKQVVRILASKRLGISCDSEPAPLAGLLVAHRPQGWRSALHGSADATTQQVEAILDAGGEALQNVEVERIEVSKGRITGVLTEFGRELVDGPLYTDLPPGLIASLLPPATLGKAKLTELVALPVQERNIVVLEADAEELPWLVWVADAHSPVVRVHRGFGRPGSPRPDRLWVELERAGEPDHMAEVAFAEVVKWAPVHRVVGVERYTLPVPTLRPRTLQAMQQLWRMGVVPVGPHAFHLPIGLAQEAALARRIHQGASVETVVASMVTLPDAVRWGTAMDGLLR